MELTVVEVYALREAQKHYDAQEKRNFKLSLLMVQNTKVLNTFIEEFEEAKKKLSTDEITEYQKTRQGIIDTHRIKKADGSFETTTVNGQMVYKLGELEQLEHKLKDFDSKHESIMEEIKKNEAQIIQLSEEKHDIKLKAITDKKMIESLDLRTLVVCAPIIKMTLTEDILGDLADKLTITDVERLTKYCEVR